MPFSIASASFADGKPMPAHHTCDGVGRSPGLSWTGIPAHAKSLVLIVDDPDAPDPRAPKRTFVHWILYNIPPDSHGLTEGVESGALPAGTLEGTNDSRGTGYTEPCPAIGQHRYYFRLYALDTVLPDLRQPGKARLLEAIEGHVIAEAQTMGTYQRKLP
jgi:Raf kinase inhibitor-like YbhB/YbcL family protein